MAKDVKCNVDTCKYNAQQRCEATSIQVGNSRCSKAKDCEQTACDTFELK